MPDTCYCKISCKSCCKGCCKKGCKKRPYAAAIAGRVARAYFWLVLLGLAAHQHVYAQTAAQSLFGNVQRMVFQARVIDIGSGDKYSIGSGFQVSAGGLIATNYHVVSAYVHEPEKYRLEILDAAGEKLPVKLRAIDVVHDLALLEAQTLGRDFLRLADGPLEKGARMYSIGNPLDLGMTIIEGTYNGLVKRSRYQKILFSGSLNSGMSGGPAVREDGAVVGVNVSKGGEQISFLVPAEKLKALLGKHAAASVETTELAGLAGSATPDFTGQIREDLFEDQQRFAQVMLEKTFANKHLGEMTIPVDLHQALRCWGHSEGEKEELKYEAVHQHCRSDDNIFIAQDLVVGGFHYDAEWVSTQELNRFQFYSFLETRYRPDSFRGSQDKKHVTPYQCHTDFVELGETTWKTTSCFRAYRKYSGLFDGFLLMAMVEANDKAAVVKIGASAFSKENLAALFRTVMESLHWNR